MAQSVGNTSITGDILAVIIKISNIWAKLNASVMQKSKITTQTVSLLRKIIKQMNN